MPDHNALASEIVAWLRAQHQIPLQGEFVDGATVAERSQLAALGGLLRQAAHADDSGTLPDDWPEELGTWLQLDGEPTELALRLKHSLASGGNILEEVYCGIVCPDSRRRLGTFFTPSAVVDESIGLARSLIKEQPSVVIDPGAGVGAFSIPALLAWQAADIAAIDTNVVTLGMLGLLAQVRGIDLDRLHLRRSDFLHLDLSEGVLGKGPRLILGNPPYTRHQELDRKTKDAAKHAAGGLVTSKLAGMSAYFLARTLNQLRPQDSTVLLLPENWIHCRYGRELRDYLWGMSHRRVDLQIYGPDRRIFPDARIGAVLLGVGPDRERRQAFRKQSPLQQQTTPGRLREDSRVGAEFGIVASARQDGDTPDASGLAAKVRRGVATGANEFFLLCDKRATSLPGTVLTPVVPRLKGIVGEKVDHHALHGAGKRGTPRWLFAAGAEHLDDPRVAAYVNRGVELERHLGVLVSRRSTWFDLRAEIVTAPVLIGPMSKGRFRVLENAVQAAYTNSLYGLTPAADVSVKELLDWLRSTCGQAALRSIARPLGSGLMKIEPRALGNLFAGSATIEQGVAGA